MTPSRLSYQHRLQLRARRPLDVRARHISIQSHTLGVAKSFYVALPPGYQSVANRNRRYPVLYLFRGHEHEWIHRWQDKSRHGRTAVDVYRQLLEAGRVGPVILVFPGISSDDKRVPGLLVNFRAPQLAENAPGVGTGRFEDYFLEELVPYIERHFRAIPGRGGRAVDGFSLGGFQAIKAAAGRPDMFSSAGSFDGTFLYAAGGGRSVRSKDRLVRNWLFSPAFGRPPDLCYVASCNPANLIWRGELCELKRVQWLIWSGPESAEPWHSNYYRGQHMLHTIRSRGIENGLPDVFAGSTHNWHWADQHLATTLPLHWKVLAAAVEADASAPR